MTYKVWILRAPGTNCDQETKYCVEYFGVNADVIHIKKLLEAKNSLSKIDGLIIPGGFSFGDHIRAGALFGKIIKEKLGDTLETLDEDGKPILGICNGFQVLIECGLLPDRETNSALTTNLSSKFECRWVDLRVENSHCIFTKGLEKTISLPVAHGEGRFLAKDADVKNIMESDRAVLTYAGLNGSKAKGIYPHNPNGSIEDIAAVCNPTGNVFGLMPHPERAFHGFTSPRWSGEESNKFGDGYNIFKNMVDYIKK